MRLFPFLTPVLALLVSDLKSAPEAIPIPARAPDDAVMASAADLGFDTHWFDAAWFEGGFPHGVGNWFCNPNSFPRGLKPVSDACRQRGLNYLVWFEPERVAPGTEIARQHPEFVHGGEKGACSSWMIPPRAAG